MEASIETGKTGMRKKLEKVFDKKQAGVLSEVIAEAYHTLVKTSDFNELKGIVKDLGIKVGELAEAQKRTEIRVEELAEAQKRTEIRVEELAVAQKESQNEIRRLDRTMRELAEEVKILARGLNETRIEVGGLSRSMGYAFENETYRLLPKLLKENYGIEMKEKLVREEIGNKEINIIGKGEMEGREILVVGEVKLRIDDKRGEDLFEELEDKVRTVIRERGEVEIKRVLITHYASKGFVKMAQQKGIILVQSYEW